MNNKEATATLKMLGWQAFIDEVGDRFTHFHLHGRIVRIIYGIKRLGEEQKYIYLAIFISIIFLTSCSKNEEKWPEDQIDEINFRLDQGINLRNCYPKEIGNEQNLVKLNILSKNGKCYFPKNERLITIEKEYVNITSRCTVDDTDVEYSISKFKDEVRSKYYDGYFCDMVIGRNFSRFNLGSLTVKEGAL